MSEILEFFALQTVIPIGCSTSGLGGAAVVKIVQDVTCNSVKPAHRRVQDYSTVQLHPFPAFRVSDKSSSTRKFQTRLLPINTSEANVCSAEERIVPQAADIQNLLPFVAL